MTALTPPHGGVLKNLRVEPRTALAVKQSAHDRTSLTLNQRQLCDLELLMIGAYSPLDGFMSETVYKAVVDDMRLSNGLLWPLPVTLDVSEQTAQTLQTGDRIGLYDQEGFVLAILELESIWRPDKRHEAQAVFGTVSDAHPGVRRLFEDMGPIYIGGRILGIEARQHYEFETLRHTPAELRALFAAENWSRVIGFHTTKPMHRLHHEITVNAAQSADANILIHPAVGIAKPGDLHYFSRVRCYRALMKRYAPGRARLSLVPLAVRMAGPREALFNAIVRQNYGCSHFIVGPEHAAPPGVRDGAQRFYPKYAAQEFAAAHQHELQIEIIATPEMCFIARSQKFAPVKSGSEQHVAIFSEKELYRSLEEGKRVPEWFSYPEVLKELARICPQRHKRGLTIFFTGLSGAGKSTLAKILYARLVEDGSRPVTLLDGDIVRKNLSSELGFARHDRDINVRRIGFVASEITKNGGIAICAPIAPYAKTRQAVREMVEQYGAFIEVHVATPLEVCESRDRKGLYAKARKGLIAEFTGISDPYEEPEKPELRIDTSETTPDEASKTILAYLSETGFFEKHDTGPSTMINPESAAGRSEAGCEGLIDIRMRHKMRLEK